MEVDMKSRDLASIALGLFLAAGPALAADMPVKAPKPAPVVASWIGFYVGFNGGYGWRDSSQVNFVANDPFALAFLTSGLGIGGTPVVPPANRLRGGFGGLQAGYNWQVNPNWLVGVEADFDGSSISGTGTTANLVAAPTLTSTVTADQRIRWFGTVRARLGVLPTENWLLYATGGFAYGRIDENVNVGFSGATSGLLVTGIGAFGAQCVVGAPACFIGASSRTTTGWTAGMGSEYTLSRNVTVKAEYLYVNLGGGDSFNVVAQTVAGPGVIPSSFRAVWGTVDFHTVRVGLNYKFDWSAPVAAKY
jgi:outer membrane immunogenic protein